jgi:hypothetical protein
MHVGMCSVIAVFNPRTFLGDVTISRIHVPMSNDSHSITGSPLVPWERSNAKGAINYYNMQEK